MLIYRLIPHRPQVLEFQLLYVSDELRRFLLKQKCFISSKGVSISCYGSYLFLEDSEGPSGYPVGITIPAELEPLKNGRLIWTEQFFRTYKKFTSVQDMNDYAKRICSAFEELTKKVRIDAGQDGNPILLLFEIL